MKTSKAMKEVAQEMIKDMKNYQIKIKLLTKERRDFLVDFGFGVWATLPLMISVILAVWYMNINFETKAFSPIYWLTGIGTVIIGFVVLIPWMAYWLRVYDKILDEEKSEKEKIK